MQKMNTTITVLSLILGAVGALTAIYLKEAVQQAILRRTLAWQLFGYLMLWKKQIVRTAALFTIYERVKARESSLRSSLAGGTGAFSRQLQEQNSSRLELQQVIREAVTSALVPSTEKSASLQDAAVLLSVLQTTLGQQRKDLIDGKTFLSDRDAAQLGKHVALNVVQLRASLHTMLTSMEHLPDALKAEESSRPALVTHLIDQFVIQGEDFLESLVRLERATDQITKKSLTRLTWDVLSKADA